MRYPSRHRLSTQLASGLLIYDVVQLAALIYLTGGIQNPFIVLLVAAVTGKLLATHIAGKILKWAPGEASIIGWLLQTKALIMIIFVNILLDKGIITSEMFTALLLMAIASTMLTVPMVSPKLARMKEIIFRST